MEVLDDRRGVRGERLLEDNLLPRVHINETVCATLEAANTGANHCKRGVVLVIDVLNEFKRVHAAIVTEREWARRANV